MPTDAPAAAAADPSKAAAVPQPASVVSPAPSCSPASPAQLHSPEVASPVHPAYVPPPPNSPLRVQPLLLDPYEKQIEFPLPWCGRILLVLIDLVLIPLKLIGALVILVIMWILCSLLMIGATPARKAGEKGFGPIRTALIRLVVGFWATPFCWCFGLITSRLLHPAARTKQGILVANHIGYVEILLLVRTYVPSVVAKAEIARYPLMGKIAQALQCVFVDRKDPGDRERVRDLLQWRASAPPGTFPPLLIFPEGTTANAEVLLKFQRGIFTTGAPVQPLAVRTHFTYFNPSWSMGEMGPHVMGLFCRIYHSVTLQELPLYTPCPAEVSDPILYADNVAQTLANALHRTVSTKTMFDNPILLGTIKRRKEATQAKLAASVAEKKLRRQQSIERSRSQQYKMRATTATEEENQETAGEVRLHVAPEQGPAATTGTAPNVSPRAAYSQSRHSRSGRKLGWAADTRSQHQLEQQQQERAVHELQQVHPAERVQNSHLPAKTDANLAADHATVPVQTAQQHPESLPHQPMA